MKTLPSSLKLFHLPSSLTGTLYDRARQAGRRGYLVVASLAGWAYAWTASPDFFWRDSGELTTCGTTFGVCHPTGFPTYPAVGRTMAFLPLGSLGFRMALFSGLAAAVTVGLVYKLVEEILAWTHEKPSLRRLGAFGASFGLAVTGLFWRNGTVAEVYAPTAALLAFGLLLLWRMIIHPSPALGLAGALVSGIAAVGLHTTLRWELVAPWFVLWVWYLGRSRQRWPKLAPVLFVVGLWSAAYLMVRSRAGTLLDWGHPADFAALWRHLTAARIRAAFHGRMMTTNRVWLLHDLTAFSTQLWDQVLGIWPLLVIVGLVASFRRAWPGGRALALMGLVLVWVLFSDFVYSFWVNPMGVRDMQNGTNLLVAGSVLAGVGLVRTARFLAQSLHALAVTTASVLALVTLVPPAVSSWDSNLKGADWGASDWARAALDEAEPESLLAVVSDDLAAGLTYLQTLENGRPDVLVLVRQHVWDTPSWVRRARRTGLELPDSLVRDYARLSNRARQGRRVPFLGEFISWWRVHRGRVYWEPGDGTDRPAVPSLRPDSPLFVVGRGGLGDVEQVAARTFEILYGLGSATTRLTGARHLTALGRWAYRRAFQKGLSPSERMKWAEASIMACHAALKFKLNHAPALINLGAALALRARLVRAGGDSEKATILLARGLASIAQGLSQEPLSRAGLLNAARYSLELGQWTGRVDLSRHALSYVRKALEAGYRDSEAYFTYGVVLANLKRFREAEQAFSKAVGLDPANSDAKFYLEKTRRLLRGGHQGPKQ